MLYQLSYSRISNPKIQKPNSKKNLGFDVWNLELLSVGRAGFEPTKASPIDLQSTPFGHSGISPYLKKLKNERFIFTLIGRLGTPKIVL
jgi:hypothetical protein